MFDDHVIWIQNPQKEVYLFMGRPVGICGFGGRSAPRPGLDRIVVLFSDVINQRRLESSCLAHFC